jgi:nucleotide-binding universal stress UspA family protein
MSMGIILVAYDGSELAKKALNKAVELLKPGDDLILAHVIPTTMIAEFIDIPPEVTTVKAHRLMNDALAMLKERKVQATGLVREGDIADTILKIGMELNVDIIVMGEKGTSKVDRFALGSVADKVVKYARRPVLIVK